MFRARPPPPPAAPAPEPAGAAADQGCAKTDRGPGFRSLVVPSANSHDPSHPVRACVAILAAASPAAATISPVDEDRTLQPAPAVAEDGPARDLRLGHEGDRGEPRRAPRCPSMRRLIRQDQDRQRPCGRCPVSRMAQADQATGQAVETAYRNSRRDGAVCRRRASACSGYSRRTRRPAPGPLHRIVTPTPHRAGFARSEAAGSRSTDPAAMISAVARPPLARGGSSPSRRPISLKPK